MTVAGSGSGRIMFVTAEDDSAAGTLEYSTSTAMSANISTEAPYNGEESESRFEGAPEETSGSVTNITSELLSNVTSQLTISDQTNIHGVRFTYLKQLDN